MLMLLQLRLQKNNYRCCRCDYYIQYYCNDKIKLFFDVDLYTDKQLSDGEKKHMLYSSVVTPVTTDLYNKTGVMQPLSEVVVDEDH